MGKVTTKPVSDRPRQEGWFRNVKVRQLLLMMFALLSLVSIFALGWNTLQVFSQQHEVEKLSASNLTGQQVLALNTLLARERGFTAALLANVNLYDAGARQTLGELRTETNRGFYLVHETGERYKLPRGQLTEKHLVQILERLDRARQRVVGTLSESRNPEVISYDDWIKEMGQIIEDVGMVNHLVSISDDDEKSAGLYAVFLRNAFFTLSEYAGRERALIGSVIARGRPLTAAEERQLDIYWGTSQLIPDSVTS